MNELFIAIVIFGVTLAWLLWKIEGRLKRIIGELITANETLASILEEVEK